MRVLLLILFLSASIAAQPSVSKVWVADNRDGTYRNPILHADYSDPDVVRVGDDFYLVASSFNAAPGLPVLHSRDLVNWTIISHALSRQPPFDVFSKPQHGNGVWAPTFTATAKVRFTPLNNGERTGLIVMGLDYAYLSVEKKQDGLYISQTVCQNADKGSAEKETAGVKLDGDTFWLRVRVQENAVCSFSFSRNGTTYVPIGQQFHPRQGKWIGAKVGIFAAGTGAVSEMGYADYDWFRVE